MTAYGSYGGVDQWGFFLWSWYRHLTAGKASALSSHVFSVVSHCLMCQNEVKSLSIPKLWKETETYVSGHVG